MDPSPAAPLPTRGGSVNLHFALLLSLYRYPRSLLAKGTSAMTDRPHTLDRRAFLGGAAVAAGLAAAPAFLRGADAASNKLIIGVVGLGRGLDHVKACLGIPDVEI